MIDSLFMQQSEVHKLEIVKGIHISVIICLANNYP